MTRTVKGSGLGLTLVKEIVEAHRGESASRANPERAAFFRSCSAFFEKRAPPMNTILIVEDEESILMPLEDNLKLEGYEVASARDGQQGLSMARGSAFDLIVLDIMLPKLDGFEVCKRLRQDRVMTPILMLTAKSQEIDKVLGLELGADDYITKPFSSRELLARIKAILRRVKEPHPGDRDPAGSATSRSISPSTRRKRTAAPVPLTALEFALLHFLVRNRGRVVHRDEVLDTVWGKDVYVDARTVDKHISLLRKKFEDDPQDREIHPGRAGRRIQVRRMSRPSWNLHGTGAKAFKRRPTPRPIVPRGCQP